MFWNLIYNEIGTASSKQTEFKLGNKNININQPTKNFNNYVLSSEDELST